MSCLRYSEAVGAAASFSMTAQSSLSREIACFISRDELEPKKNSTPSDGSLPHRGEKKAEHSTQKTEHSIQNAVAYSVP